MPVCPRQSGSSSYEKVLSNCVSDGRVIATRSVRGTYRPVAGPFSGRSDQRAHAPRSLVLAGREEPGRWALAGIGRKARCSIGASRRSWRCSAWFRDCGGCCGHRRCLTGSRWRRALKRAHGALGSSALARDLLLRCAKLFKCPRCFLIRPGCEFRGASFFQTCAFGFGPGNTRLRRRMRGREGGVPFALKRAHAFECGIPLTFEHFGLEPLDFGRNLRSVSGT